MKVKNKGVCTLHCMSEKIFKIQSPSEVGMILSKDMTFYEMIMFNMKYGGSSSKFDEVTQQMETKL